MIVRIGEIERGFKHERHILSFIVAIDSIYT